MVKCAISNCKDEGVESVIGGKICTTHDREFVYRVSKNKCGWCGEDPIDRISTCWCGNCEHKFLNF